MKKFLPLVFVLLLIGCTMPPSKIPKFHAGDIVRSVLTGQKGQILNVLCWDTECQYDVRFPDQELDGVHEFELRPDLGTDEPSQQ